MIGLIWTVVDTIYSLLKGPEKTVPEEKESGSSECGPKSNFKKPLETSLDTCMLKTTVSQNGVSGVNTDLKYLSNCGAKSQETEQYMGLSLIKYFKKDFEKRLALNITTKHRCSRTDTRENSIKMNALVPARKPNAQVNNTTSGLVINLSGSQSDNFDHNNKHVILEDLEDKTVCFLTRKTSYKNMMPKDIFSQSLKENKTKNYFYIRLGENELRAIKKIAQCVTNTLALADSAPNSSYNKGKALAALEFYKNDCDTTVEKSFTFRNHYAFKVYNNKTFTSISIIELGSVEDALSRKKTLIQKSKELQKYTKCTNEKNGRKQKKHKNGDILSYSKYKRGHIELCNGKNEICTNNELLMEIARELKPIKIQVNELQQALADYSLVNFQKKKVKSTVLSLNSLVWSSSKLKSYTHFHSYNQQVRNKVEVLDCSDNSLHMSKPKKLCPLAQMYIALSKENFT